METIKVNMTPCDDVQTIHASQNDNEAREWGFELHNNGEKIDSSSISDQMVFKAYEGGTEEILPTNGSTPTTSPFKGDIKYPQGLLSDQEFLYRESPTEEDGLAKITDIKGNTLVWNQLVGRTDSYTTNKNGITITITGTPNKNISLTAQGTVSITVQDLNYYGLVQPINVKNGHKYFLSSTSSNFLLFGYGAGTTAVNQLKSIFTSASDGTMSFSIRPVTSAATEGKVINETFYVMFIDLSQMFGIGNEPSTVEEFTSLFSLPYYAYNQGTLLSFMGNGIKTVGKNLFDFSQFANGTITFENGVLTGTGGQFYTAYNDIVNKGIELKYPKNTQITISFDARTEQNQSSTGGGLYLTASENGTATQLAVALNNTTTIQHKTVTIPSDRHIDKLGWTYGSGSNNIWHITNFQIEFGTTETSYVPYTSSTLSLPISTYFPNGMKSAGNVYDELTPAKAITRIGAVDLGSLTWQYLGNNAFLTTVNELKPPTSNGDIINAKSSKYSVVAYNTLSGDVSLVCLSGYIGTNRIYVRDTSYTDATAFKQAMTDQNVKLYYELATPTETSFTTASLVTENAEIPLSNEDGVLIGKCTEQLSENPGFIDAKIKLADEDGECYSNKIQLHIERSPQ